MGKTLVLGIGNLLMGDDGVGVHAIRRLEKAEISPSIELLDGGTAGLDLLSYMEGVTRLLIIDASEMDQPPGTIARLAGDEVPAYLSIKTSPHEIGLTELLASAKLLDLYPPEVIIWAVQPAGMFTGLELSEPVAAQLDRLEALVIADLRGDYTSSM